MPTGRTTTQWVGVELGYVAWGQRVQEERADTAQRWGGQNGNGSHLSRSMFLGALRRLGAHITSRAQPSIGFGCHSQWRWRAKEPQWVEDHRPSFHLSRLFLLSLTAMNYDQHAIDVGIWGWTRVGSLFVNDRFVRSFSIYLPFLLS